MIGRVLRGATTALAMVTVVSTVAGCGLLGDTSSSDPAATGPLELASIKVLVLRAIDTAPLWRAVDRGYFTDEGLTVEPIPAKSGPEAVDAVVADTVKIGFASYPAVFNAQAQGRGDGLRLVADGYAAASRTFMVVAAPGSGITEAQDLAGRRIAVSSTGTISDLATLSTLDYKGVPSTGINWVTVPFNLMNSRLKAGDVDAAVMVEPFITEAQMQLGEKAALVMDCASGPTNEIPLAGWVATKSFVDQYPKTLAAFQRGLARAVEDVTQRPILDKVLVDNLDTFGINRNVAPLLTPGTFPAALDRTRLQRVVDLMRRYSTVTKLPGDFELAPMLVPSAATETPH